ncbi:hypothetical protein MMC07_006249 [Pseudocyphellaria aurata]|nr:hypothetical protein [Pseudocyphellaria aurata]
MKRALALRTPTPERMRTMQTVLISGEILARQFWRDPRKLQQKRLKSSTQQARIVKDELTPAVLHGSPRLPQLGLQLEKSSSKTSIPRQAPSASPKVGKWAREHGHMLPDHPRSSQESPKVLRKRAERSSKKGPARGRSVEQRTASEVQLKDEDYLRNHIYVPNAQDYPGTSPAVFESPKSALRNLSARSFKADVSRIMGRFGFRCTVSFEIKGHKEVCIGESQSRDAAERTAYLHVLAKLHELGMLSNLFTESLKLDSKTRADEKDAKIDIYNYAARFDSIPNFEARILESPLRFGGKRLVEVTVDLAEQNIRVVAKGPDGVSAEIAAALRFKEQAELYHAQSEKGSIVIRDSEALTTANSKKFFDFYTMICPDAKIEVVSEPQDIFGEGCHKCQVKISDELVGKPVVVRTKKGALDLAYLTAAIALKKKQPELYPQFLRALRLGNGTILKPLAPTSMRIQEDAVRLMRETLVEARKLRVSEELSNKTDRAMIDEANFDIIEPFQHLRRVSPQAAQVRNSQMKDAHHTFLQNPRLQELRDKRSELPMNQYRAKVLDLVNNNPYSIIVGATGSGKTTQVPQILLEEAIEKGSGSDCNIICTQPRRIAATSVARRVAQERAETLQDTVGYHVRFDVKKPRNRGSITYCTLGVLLRQLQISSDDVMDRISHFIIDEVHERSMDVDFALVFLKRVIRERTNKGLSSPKVVIMSATIDTELFASYFSSGKGTVDCPSLTVPGRTFPVKEKYLDMILNELEQSYPASSLQIIRADKPTCDYLKINNKYLGKQSAHDAATANESVIDWKKERKLTAEGEVMTGNATDDAVVPHALVAMAIAHIAKTSDQGAILAFLPGLEEIVKVESWLTGTPLLGVNFKDASKFKIYKLHSSFDAGQVEVFETVPSGCRKIILSTNIAETSITIPDVRYVVDSGKAREKQYDPVRRFSKFACSWISKSNSKQRAGRAGRVQNGYYYALFPKESYDLMRASPLAEILRSDLQGTCLAIKTQAFTVPIREFLAEAIEPPPAKAVDASVINLEALGALTSDEQLTPLGKLLATIPIHPSLGKMILLGVIFRCLDPILIIGTAAAERSIFNRPLERRNEAQARKAIFAEESESDYIALINAVRNLRYHKKFSEHAMMSFATENFISPRAFRGILGVATQIEEILVNAGLIPFAAPLTVKGFQFGHPSVNTNSSNMSLINAIALAGLHPNLAVSTFSRVFRTPGESAVIIQPSSVNSQGRKKDSGKPYGALYSYGSMTTSPEGGLKMLRDTARCTPLMAALFGGTIINTQSNVLEMDGWLPWWVKTVGRSKVHNVAQMIVTFREELDRVLSRSFEDLLHTTAPEDNRQAPSANTKLRSLFADRVVKLLNQEVPHEQVRSHEQATEPVRRRDSGRRGTSHTADRFDADDDLHEDY